MMLPHWEVIDILIHCYGLCLFPLVSKINREKSGKLEQKKVIHSGMETTVVLTLNRIVLQQNTLSWLHVCILKLCVL